MNKQMLFGLPIGTRVTLGGKNGILTNASAMEIFKTYEITFDDGSVITRDELVDKDKEEWDLVPHEEWKETVRKKDWYKSEMEAVRKDLQECNEIRKGEALRAKELAKVNINLQDRLSAAVDKAQGLTIENVKLTKRLDELIGDATIVVEKGEVKPFEGVGVFKDDGVPIAHSPDIYSSGPIGAPVKLATEIVKVLNKENIEKILKDSGGQARVGEIAEKLESSARAVYRFISKTTGIFVGKLPEPDYKEENADAWLEGQQKVSEPEAEKIPDAWGVNEDSESSEQPSVPVDDKAIDDGPQDEEE